MPHRPRRRRKKAAPPPNLWLPLAAILIALLVTAGLSHLFTATRQWALQTLQQPAEQAEPSQQVVARHG